MLHGNRAITLQTPVHIDEWILFICTDWQAYSAPVQAKVKSLYAGTFKTKNPQGVSTFPFPIEP